MTDHDNKKKIHAKMSQTDAFTRKEPISHIGIKGHLQGRKPEDWWVQRPDDFSGLICLKLTGVN